MRSTGWESLVYTKVYATPGEKPNEKRKNANLPLCMATYRSLITVLWSGGYTFRSIMSIIHNLPKMKRKEVGEERIRYVGCNEVRKLTAQNIIAGSTQAPHLFHTLQLQFSSRFRVGTHCDVSLSRIYIDATNMSSLTWPIIAFAREEDLF